MKVTESELAAMVHNVETAIRHPLDRKARNARGFIVPKGMKAESEHEARLAQQLRGYGVTAFERQYRIHPDRKFMADFYFPKARVVVEVDGGGFVDGRHGRGAGMDADSEKTSYIARMPARLIRLTPKWISNGQGVRWVLEAIGVEIKRI